MSHPLSSRGTLATFENAYRLAIRMGETTGHKQFVVRTNNPFQPFRIQAVPPGNDDDVLVLVA